MIFYYPWTDKLVVMGNHRDAWVFGAVDPSSGTAVMMEIARGLGQLKKQGGWEREWRVLSAVCMLEEGVWWCAAGMLRSMD